VQAAEAGVKRNGPIAAEELLLVEDEAASAALEDGVGSGEAGKATANDDDLGAGDGGGHRGT
jgi:hypothetical protein